jgi:hypothetical protein
VGSERDQEHPLVSRRAQPPRVRHPSCHPATRR